MPLVIEHGHAQGHGIIRQVLEEVLAGAVADVGGELEARVQERVCVVAHQHRHVVVGHVVAHGCRQAVSERRVAMHGGPK